MSALQASTVVNGLLGALPSILEVFAAHHAAQNPDGTPLTREQARVLLEATVQASLARDEQLRHASAADLGIHTGSVGE